MTVDEMVQMSINTIRTLSIDAVQQAKSGHPGTPMALAPLVYTIWNRTMRYDPKDPIWPNRDRFVLSNGHASMLLWSVLHLTGVQAVNADYERLGHLSVTLDDIRRFRQRQRRDIRVGFVCQPHFTMPHEFHRHTRKHTTAGQIRCQRMPQRVKVSTTALCIHIRNSSRRQVFSELIHVGKRLCADPI